ncbi:hypothetical protein MMC13_000392 [Lambiella insularis]|nr:hypothetical protein [Lambiella insularis]
MAARAIKIPPYADHGDCKSLSSDPLDHGWSEISSFEVSSHVSPNDDDEFHNTGDAGSISMVSRFQSSMKLLTKRIRGLGPSIVFAGLITGVKAAPDFDRCCQIRARQLLTQVNDVPWLACGINSTDTSTTNPSVKATIDWCVDNCGSGYLLTDIKEWLHPLAVWMAPYATLLLLSPVGEEAEEDEGDVGEVSPIPTSTSWHIRSLRKVLLPLRDSDSMSRVYIETIRSVLYFVREYFNILGDPSSAIWGTLSEIESDVRLATLLIKQRGWYKKDMIRTVILARQTKFNEHKWGTLTNGLLFRRLLETIELALLSSSEGTTGIKGLRDLRNFLVDINKRKKLSTLLPDNYQHHSRSTPYFVKAASVSNLNLKTCLSELKKDLSEMSRGIPDTKEKFYADGVALYPGEDVRIRRELLQQLRKIIPDDNSDVSKLSWSKTLLKEEDLAVRQLETGMKAIFKARIPLVSGIVLPTVLALAVTASIFFDAYNALGDNDTAHSLAYGVLYSWLLVVVVVGNSYATCVNPGLVKETIGELVSISGKTLPFRKRYSNAVLWKAWLDNVLKGTDGDKPDEHWVQGRLDRTFKDTFSTWFYLKFLIGHLIGWLLVGVATGSAATVSYTTPSVGLGCRSFNHMLYGVIALVVALLHVVKHWVYVYSKGWKRDIVNWLYTFLVYSNALVLLIGTAFNLAGVYRSCRCMVLFTTGDFVVELGTMTPDDLAEASQYWIPVGYVAFTVMWIVCVCAIAVRGYIKALIEDSMVEKTGVYNP